MTSLKNSGSLIQFFGVNVNCYLGNSIFVEWHLGFDSFPSRSWYGFLEFFKSLEYLYCDGLKWYAEKQ